MNGETVFSCVDRPVQVQHGGSRQKVTTSVVEKGNPSSQSNRHLRNQLKRLSYNYYSIHTCYFEKMKFLTAHHHAQWVKSLVKTAAFGNTTTTRHASGAALPQALTTSTVLSRRPMSLPTTNNSKEGHLSSLWKIHHAQYRYYSAPAAFPQHSSTGGQQQQQHQQQDDNTPQGDLFEHASGDDAYDDDTNNGTTICNSSPTQDWVGRTGRIKRTFGAQANADAMLLCGGAALAAHASFDPQYTRAQGWIHNHAVGPAVLSPVLTSGLIHTLTEAAFPNSVPLTQSMQQIRPLIVGVSVYATIQVEKVTQNQLRTVSSVQQQQGFQIDLRATVSRVRDEVVISQGQVSIWLADVQQQQQHHAAAVDDYTI